MKGLNPFEMSRLDTGEPIKKKRKRVIGQCEVCQGKIHGKDYKKRLRCSRCTVK